MDKWLKKSNKRKKNKQINKKGQGGIFGRGKEARREREKKFFFSSLLSKIYGNRTIGFHRSKMQSRSTHRELRVGTKILEFCHTPRGREFSYLGSF